MDRATLLTFAAELYTLANSVDGPILRPTNDEKTDDSIESSLRTEAEKAATALAQFRRSRAISASLGAIMPGWKYVDASDWLPREKWRTFVSSDKDEWLAWLAANSRATPEQAKKLVDGQWGEP